MITLAAPCELLSRVLHLCQNGVVWLGLSGPQQRYANKRPGSSTTHPPTPKMGKGAHHEALNLRVWGICCKICYAFPHIRRDSFLFGPEHLSYSVKGYRLIIYYSFIVAGHSVCRHYCTSSSHQAVNKASSHLQLLPCHWILIYCQFSCFGPTCRGEIRTKRQHSFGYNSIAEHAPKPFSRPLISIYTWSYRGQPT